jgi:hypothetical protein
MEPGKNVKSALGDMACPVHNKHPHITTAVDGSLHLECCCDEFKVQCYHVVKKTLDGTTGAR